MTADLRFSARIARSFYWRKSLIFQLKYLVLRKTLRHRDGHSRTVPPPKIFAAPNILVPRNNFFEPLIKQTSCRP